MTELPTDMKAHNRKLIEQFRANGGVSDRPLLLLTTTGARSGQPRTRGRNPATNIRAAVAYGTDPAGTIHSTGCPVIAAIVSKSRP